ncbi:hypothetical protein FRC04_006836, partial [Tulasnella sp. 424]
MPAARNAKGQFISSTAQSSQPSTDPPVMSGASSTSAPNQPSTSAPIQPSTSSPSPATSLNATDIATIVQAVLLVNQQQQVQAQPQQSQTAHFTGPPSINPTAGKLSVQDLFPEVEGSVLASVLGHTLTASDLYKLNARYRDKPDRSTLELDGTSLRIRGDATARDYPSFSYIHQPLVNYFTVLIHHVLDCKYFAAAAMLYVGQLQKLNDEYEWSAVLRYHLAFFNVAAGRCSEAITCAGACGTAISLTSISWAIVASGPPSRRNPQGPAHRP